MTDGWGAEIVFEASGSNAAISSVFEPLCPGGHVVLVGMPGGPVPYDVVAAAGQGGHGSSTFSAMRTFTPVPWRSMGSGKIDLKPLITDRFAFKDSVKAFDFAAAMPPTSVKAQIEFTN